MNDSAGVMKKVRAALGRQDPLTAAPIPPVLDESVIRLVSPNENLAELFAARAAACKMYVESIDPDAVTNSAVEFLRSKNVTKLAISPSPLLERLGFETALKSAGFEVFPWDQITLDQLYDMDAAVTDVFKAIAETGSLAVRSSPAHGRALSLVPMVHVAIVEHANLVPDLLDFFSLLEKQQDRNGISLITGPSKTADIELNLVTGVHGPGYVHIFIVP